MKKVFIVLHLLLESTPVFSKDTLDSLKDISFNNQISFV